MANEIGPDGHTRLCGQGGPFLLSNKSQRPLHPHFLNFGGTNMADTQQLDRTFHFIMETFIQRGNAPHYTEIARAFGANPDEGRRLLKDVINSGAMPMWLYPGTDLIASFAPFNNLPTQYRITVDGQQKWFAQ